MRRIVSKQEAEKKSKRNQLIVGGILISLMLLSTLGYAFINQDQPTGTTGNSGTISYKGYNFVGQDSYWYLQIGTAQFVFRYNPNEVERINGSINLISAYSAKPLYLQSDSLESDQEILRNMEGIILRSQYACLDPENCTGDYPVKTCQDNFIIIEKSNQSEIVQDNNCVFIRGQEEDLVKLADEFLFKIIGVD